MPDFLPIAEKTAKAVAHTAKYVADSITARRNGFSDDEAGDYLRCAGADALAEYLPWPNVFVPQDSATTIPPVADDPASVSSDSPAPPAAGSSLSDSELFSAAADVIETWMPHVMNGGTAALWTAEFAAMLRDRAAQFRAIEAVSTGPLDIDRRHLDCDICNPT